MKKILFRADAKPSIGIGDLVSLINLSKYFERAGWQAHFIVRNSHASAVLLEKNGLSNHLVLDKDISIKEEVALMNEYIAANHIDAVMLEITERSLADYSGITEKAVRACVIFDAAVPEWADIAVNWDVDADSALAGKKCPLAKLLFGVQYVVIPVSFDFNEINKRIYRKEPETLLVAMGGADEFDLTKKVIVSLCRNRVDLKLHVVVGSGYRSRSSLEDALSDYPAEYTVKQNVDDMFGEYMNCDVAVGAGGLTSFELIATRTPSLLVAAYEHQKARCAYFDKMRWATYLGFRDFDESVFLEKLEKPDRIPPKGVYRTDEIRKAVDEALERH